MTPNKMDAFAELFADLIALKPMDIHEYMDKTGGQPILHLLCEFPREVALALVNALLPLIRYSPSLRNKLIALILHNILSGRFSARLICVESALVLLKYLRITVDQFGSDANSDSAAQTSAESHFLTQCSQFACTQIASESAPLPISNLDNDSVCNEILQIIDASCRQHPDTKAIIYKGLVQVIERNFYFSGKVVLFLLERLQEVMNPADGEGDSVSNPFVIGRLLSGGNRDCQPLREQLAVLVSCLAESVRLCTLNMPPGDILSNAVPENQRISDAVAKADKIIEKICSYLVTDDVVEISSQQPDQSLSNRQLIVGEFIDLYDVVLVHLICTGQCHSEMIEKLFAKKEAIIKSYKTDKKGKSIGYSTVLSLATLIKAIRYSFQSVLSDVKKIGGNSHGHSRPTQRRNAITQRSILEPNNGQSITSNIAIDDSNDDNDVSVILQNEKVSIYLLNRAMNLVKKIGSPEYRVSYRNREEICLMLADFIELSLGYYVDCLVLDNVDRLTSFQRQIMQLCMAMYCLAVNKIIQFCSKKIDLLSNGITPEIRKHRKTLELTLGIVKEEETSLSSRSRFSMSSFIKLNKLIIARILLVSVRKLHGDIDGLLNVTVNLAIYSGIEDARPEMSERINVFILKNFYNWTWYLLKHSKVTFQADGRDVVKKIEFGDTAVCRSLVATCLTTARFVKQDSVHLLEEIVADVCSRIGSYSGVRHWRWEAMAIGDVRFRFR